MTDPDADTLRRDHAVQHLVRYEAMFRLLDEIQQLESVEAISQRVARQWKYFANVACWRLVLPRNDGFAVIDGQGGEATLSHRAQPDPWDAHQLLSRIPRLVRPDEWSATPRPPAHLTGRGVAEIQVQSFLRQGQCIGLLSVGARNEPFSALDSKFIRSFGRHLTNRLFSSHLLSLAMAALQRKAAQDTLTGLLNRGAIIEHLDTLTARATACGAPLAVILADIDVFKAVNDSHGHLAGDQVLRVVADRLKAHCRAQDAVGRYGGEEFLIVLAQCAPEDLAPAAERFRRAIADQPIRIGEGPPVDLSVTISLGATATSGCGPVRLEDLIRRADAALYESKRQGRNCLTLG